MSDAPRRWLDSEIPSDLRDVLRSASGPSWQEAHWPVVSEGPIPIFESEWEETEKRVSTRVMERAHKAGVEISWSDVQQATRDSIRALMLIRAYRIRGHLAANLDPLGLEPPREHPELDPRSYGFADSDFDRRIFLDHVLGLEFGTLRQILAILKRTYCQTLGVEFMHISDPAQKGWLQERIEGPAKEISFTREGKRAILNKLVEAEGFERFCDLKFTATKRFGLDGAESMIPALEQIIKRGGALGVKEIAIGMAHRGRLNVLAQVLAKPHRAIFHEFKGGSYTPENVEGSGDVKYHLGASSDREFDGNSVHLSLTANPSHLEIVNPVVLGKTRAKQDLHGCTPEDRTCVIVDDMVDTANTLCEAAAALKDHGADKVLAYCTHPVLSGKAIERISSSALDEVVVTDSIPLREEARACKRIRVLTVASLLAETMRRISAEDSVSSLFVE